METITVKCNHWHQNTRCKNEATVLLINHEGGPNPGGQMCKQHADEVVNEYAEKLAWQWNTMPIDEFGAILISDI